MLLATLGLPLSHSNLISTGPKTEDQDGGPTRVIWREWSQGCVWTWQQEEQWYEGPCVFVPTGTRKSWMEKTPKQAPSRRHSRKEGEGTRMEDDACDPFLPEDRSPSHSCFKWTHLHPQSAGTDPGTSPLCQ